MSERPDPAHYPIDLGEEPDLQAVLQDDSDRGVPVRLMAPVQTREVPARAGAMLSFRLGLDAESVLGKDQRRKRAIVQPDGQPVYVALTRQECSAGTGYVILAGAQLEILHSGQVYARCAEGTEARLSVMTEMWAD